MLAIFVPALRTPVLAAQGLLALALVLDLLRTPNPERLEVRRDVPRRAPLSGRFERRVRVRSGPAAGCLLELREQFPAEFRVVRRTWEGAQVPALEGDVTGGPDRVRLDAEETVITRSYVPELRGTHALGELRLRLLSPWGLVWRQRRFGGADGGGESGGQTIEVEPALSGLSRTLALAASDRWRDLGVRRLRQRGGQMEFESLRDYVSGDDVRSVDWKAFARRGKPTVRQYEEERGQELILLVDAGRRMRAVVGAGQHRGWTKLDWALDAALELAAVALQQGDRVGCALFDDRLDAYVAPAKGARQFARLRGAVFERRPSGRDSDLARALREVAARHRRRAMVVVLSDVADPLSVGRQRAALASASRRHAVVFAALDDPQLREAVEGRLPANHPAPAALRAAAFEGVRDRRLALRELAGSRARVIDALPAEAAGPLLAAWLDARRTL